MSRIFILLLLIGVSFGLATQQPVQAFAASSGRTAMAKSPAHHMAAMPDCATPARKATGRSPCDCGSAGCIGMMTPGATMMLAVADGIIRFPIASENAQRIGASAVLRGRSTPPEPEPPSLPA